MDPEVSDQEKEAVAQKIYAQEATESEGQGRCMEKLKQTTSLQVKEKGNASQTLSGIINKVNDIDIQRFCCQHSCS